MYAPSLLSPPNEPTTVLFCARHPLLRRLDDFTMRTSVCYHKSKMMTATETKTQEPDVNGLSTHIATIIERGGCLFFCLSACACAPRSVAKGDDGANLLLLFFFAMLLSRGWWGRGWQLALQSRGLGPNTRGARHCGNTSESTDWATWTRELVL